MMQSLSKILQKCFFTLLMFFPSIVFAQGDLTGIWTFQLYIDNVLNSQQTWNISQQGTAISGSGTEGALSWTFSGGFVSANGLAITSTYDQSELLIYYSGTTTESFNAISGNFSSSVGAVGTFLAQKNATSNSTVLDKSTIIDIAPTVKVSRSVATVIAKKFKSVRTSKKLLLKAQSKPTIEYTAVLKKAESSRVLKRSTSKRNVLTFTNLAPGNYTASYSVTARKNGKKLFTTNTSPTATFTVQ